MLLTGEHFLELVKKNEKLSETIIPELIHRLVRETINSKKLELLCGCTIDEILIDLSVLRNKNLTPQFVWMRAVSKEEAEQSLPLGESGYQK